MLDPTRFYSNFSNILIFLKNCGTISACNTKEERPTVASCNLLTHKQISRGIFPPKLLCSSQGENIPEIHNRDCKIQCCGLSKAPKSRQEALKSPAPSDSAEPPSRDARADATEKPLEISIPAPSRQNRALFLSVGVLPVAKASK